MQVLNKFLEDTYLRKKSLKKSSIEFLEKIPVGILEKKNPEEFQEVTRVFEGKPWRFYLKNSPDQFLEVIPGGTTGTNPLKDSCRISPEEFLGNTQRNSWSKSPEEFVEFLEEIFGLTAITNPLEKISE